MDGGEWRQVAGGLRAFHRRFAPLFGRKEAQRHGAQYVRGLLATREERRNAENLAEAVVGTELKAARALQQFLTDSPWRHEAVVAELHRFLAEALLPQDAGEGVAADGVFTLDSTGFAKRGTRSAGVARQYSGTLGKVDNCQIGVFLGYATARGHALLDGQLWLPREWADDPARCRGAGVPEAVIHAGYQSQAEVGLALLRRAREVGALVGRWVTADEAFGQVPAFRDALDAAGWWYVAEVPCTTPVFAAPPTTHQVELTPGAPPRPVEVQPAAQPAQDVAAALPPACWTTVTVADGAQGPRLHRVAAVRVRESRDGVPGRDCWLALRRNLDGSEPKYYLSNAPEDTPLAELARVGAARWTVETEFQTTKGLVGLDEYEVRSWPGWHHHVTLCLLANAFLLSLQRAWTGAGEKGLRGRRRFARPTRSSRPARAAAAAARYPTAGRPDSARDLAPAPLDLRRPAPLAGRNPPPHRLRQSLPHQAPAPTAA
jgi:SRSO17 transposase